MTRTMCLLSGSCPNIQHECSLWGNYVAIRMTATPPKAMPRAFFAVTASPKTMIPRSAPPTRNIPKTGTTMLTGPVESARNYPTIAPVRQSPAANANGIDRLVSDETDQSPNRAATVVAPRASMMTAIGMTVNAGRSCIAIYGQYGLLPPLSTFDIRLVTTCSMYTGRSPLSML